MQDANKREKPARSREVGFDLVFQRVQQMPRATIMDSAAGHVDSLDFLRGIASQGFVIAVTNSKIVAHAAAQTGHAKANRARLLARLVGQMPRQHSVDYRQLHLPRPAMPVFQRSQRLEQIVFDQIAQGHLALFLDIVAARNDCRLVKRDGFNPVGFVDLLHWAQCLPV